MWRITTCAGEICYFSISTAARLPTIWGVYLGDGQFIESPRTGETIRVSQLAEPFWQDHFLGARRILTEETIL
ncbi:C40 family peptidase [Escherichia coli]|nr:C40 family peptidase [Escherichia coli]